MVYVRTTVASGNTIGITTGVGEIDSVPRTTVGDGKARVITTGSGIRFIPI
jgi:hypothetical protein